MYYYPPIQEIEDSPTNFRKQIGIIYSYIKLKNIKPVRIDIKSLEDNLDICNWMVGLSSISPLNEYIYRPRDILNSLRNNDISNENQEIINYINNFADLSYPIIISHDNHIIDGICRLIKAVYLDESYIDSYIIDEIAINSFKRIKYNECQECFKSRQHICYQSCVNSFYNEFLSSTTSSIVYPNNIHEKCEKIHIDYERTGYRIKTDKGYKQVNTKKMIDYIISNEFNLDIKLYNTDLIFSYINIFNPSKENIMTDTILFNLSDNVCCDIHNIPSNQINNYVEDYDFNSPIIIDKNNNIIYGMHILIKANKHNIPTLMGYIFDDNLLSKFLINRDMLSILYKIHIDPDYHAVYDRLMNGNYALFYIINMLIDNFISPDV